ncbi:MAG: rhodanese-like domain-containing protein [Clostridiales bacterium]|nr:rhodanese-like domain-containing protein [Clostridiales bacterium]
MKPILIIISMLCLLLLTGCGAREQDEAYHFVSVSAEEAKEIMDTQWEYVILDVRTQEEYDEGHIEGAILIPDYEIGERAEDELPDRDRLILVYCRSGRRSKLAAEELVSMGYTNVVEFGGIIDWPYQTENN